MTALIKSVEIPENCYKCPFAMEYYSTLYMSKAGKFRKDYCCVITHKTLTSTKRNRFCPLVEVVHCEDCDMWDEKNKRGGDKVYGDLAAPCRYFSNGDGYIVYTKPNDCCSKGKRKESEE